MFVSETQIEQHFTCGQSSYYLYLQREISKCSSVYARLDLRGKCKFQTTRWVFFRNRGHMYIHFSQYNDVPHCCARKCLCCSSCTGEVVLGFKLCMCNLVRNPHSPEPPPNVLLVRYCKKKHYLPLNANVCMPNRDLDWEKESELTTE